MVVAIASVLLVSTTAIATVVSGADAATAESATLVHKLCVFGFEYCLDLDRHERPRSHVVHNEAAVAGRTVDLL